MRKTSARTSFKLFAVTGLGLAVALETPDAFASRLIWTDINTAKIQSADLDGSNVQDLVTGQGTPLTIAVDDVAGKFYWTDEATDKIQRADLDGTNVENLVIISSEVSGITLDVAAGKMYFANRNPRVIQRSNLDGSNIESIITTGLLNVRHMAIDPAGGKLYWSDENIGIRRANLNGSSLETLASAVEPRGVALDVASGKVYWVDNGGNSTAPRIRRANLDGSSPETLVTTGLFAAQGLALDLAAGKMYWGDKGAGVFRADLDGSNVEDVVTGLPFVSGLALLPTLVPPDQDGDGIEDSSDECPDSDLGPTVVIDGGDTGVTNDLLADGCTLADLVAEVLEGDPSTEEVVHFLVELKGDGVISGQELGAILRTINSP